MENQASIPALTVTNIGLSKSSVKKKNDDYWTLRLESEHLREGSTSSKYIGQSFAGSSSTTKRSGFLTISKEDLAAMQAKGLVKGSNYNDFVSTPVGFSLFEITATEYAELSEEEQSIFRMKVPYANAPALLTENGEAIYSTNQLFAASKVVTERVANVKFDRVAYQEFADENVDAISEMKDEQEYAEIDEMCLDAALLIAEAAPKAKKKARKAKKEIVA